MPKIVYKELIKSTTKFTTQIQALNH